MNTRPSLVASLAVLALAGCNGDNGSARAERSTQENASHSAAAAAMDASFDKEMGEPKPKPAAEKPAAEKPKPAAVAEKPKPKPEAKPAIEQGRPAWVDQLPQEAGKLYAVGGAMKGRREDARRKALTELASSLKVNVRSTTTINEGEIAKIGPGGERVGHAWSNYKTEARLSVDRDLTYAQVIAEAESGKDTWALAELDRAAWAAKLRQEIEEVDNQLRAEGNRLAEAGKGMHPAARALKAVGPLAARRDALVSDLILADPQSKPPAWPIDLQALLQACAKGLATVTIRLEGAPDAVFAARTQEAMAKQGLAVNDKAGSVVLRLALRETPRKLSNDWHSIAVAGSATVLDPNNGNVAGSLQIDEKGVDPDAAQARAKMLDKASAAIAAAISDRLIDLLAGGTDVGNGPAVAAPVAPAPVVVAPPAPAPTPAPAPAVTAPTVTAPVVAAPTVAAPTTGEAAIDQHFIYADEVFIDDKPYEGEGWSYVELAKVLQLPSAESRGQGKYFPIVKGKEVWTAHAWSSRPIAANEIVLGQTVIVCNDNQRDSVYLPPATKREARTGDWFIGRITDVSDLFKNQVTVAGHYTIATSNLRVIALVK